MKTSVIILMNYIIMVIVASIMGRLQEYLTITELGEEKAGVCFSVK